MLEWQPIETAPKDGKPILLVSGGEVVIGWWFDVVNDHGDHRGWISHDDDGTINLCRGKDGAPTHWMPLPEPPK